MLDIDIIWQSIGKPETYMNSLLGARILPEGIVLNIYSLSVKIFQDSPWTYICL